MKKLILTVLVLCKLSIFTSLVAHTNPFAHGLQQQQAYHIKGVVTSENKRLQGVTIELLELQLTITTDAKGNFEFSNLPSGNYTLSVRYTGMKPLEVKVAGKTALIVDLLPNSIALEDVNVLGQRGNIKGATSTRISRQAIEHLQASSLAEVLQLLPGQAITNPSFSQVNTPLIRQIGSNPTGQLHDNESRYAASLGTSIVINGAQLSNNANMQAANTATGGVLSTFSSSSGLGTDLRQISADNIESIEVIRGIPSVEYGDLTAGVIDVKTKASVEPLQAKFRLNPTLRQAWAGQGFALGTGALFADIDYTYAANSQTQTTESYQRFNTSFQYTNTFGRLYSNSTLVVGGYYDDSKIDPDLETIQSINKAENYDFRFATNGRWHLDKKFARHINYVLSVQLGQQNGFQQSLSTGGVTAVSGALTDVTQEVSYLPSSYLQQTWIKGKPLSIQARISDNFYLSSGSVKHALLVGLSHAFEKNYGRGRYYADGMIPRTQDGIGYRPRAFSDIPGLNQFAAFVEDKATTAIFNRPFTVVAGLRYDLVQPFKAEAKSALSPRVNASYDIFSGFKLRGGYGYSAKMPTLIYLYPDNAYVDVFSLNYYRQNPAEAMALMTTKVFATANTALEIAQSRKAELGFDFKRLSVTYFTEHTDNAYDMTQYYNFANIPAYTVASQSAGEKPVLSDVITNELFVTDYNVPTNHVNIFNRGLEFDLDLGRVKALRTSFAINGAYMYTKREGNVPYVYARRVAGEVYDRLGVYEARGRDFTRFLTTMRAVHHIPELRLILSLTAQTIWIDKDRYLNYTNRPYGIIQMTEGGADQIQLLSDSEIAAIPETSGLYISVADTYYRAESWKPLWLVNTKLTKEFGKNYGFSFYVNNITNHRPFQAGTRNPTNFEKRNIPLYFGSELTFKF